jgi:uncharacterized protein YqeY
MNEAPDPAAAMKARLREDLNQAVKARSPFDMSVLRSLIAALDNAEAVPVGEAHDRYVVHHFGDRSAEAPRLTLTEAEIRSLFEREAATRLEAAQELEGLGKDEWAATLREEAALVMRYLET